MSEDDTDQAAVRIAGDRSAEELRALVEQSRRRSAVWDVLTHGTAHDLDVTVG